MGGVGYFNLSDLSAGPLVAERLKREGLAAHVDVVDLSYGGPIAAMHRLDTSEPRYGRLVLVGAVDRGARAAGFRWYRWTTGDLPADSEIQSRVAEAVTGVIDLDSFPIIAGRLGTLPPDVRIVEISPVAVEAGLEPSPELDRILPDICRLVRELAEEGAAA